MIELTEQPIDTARLLAHVNHPECGAEVLFVGTTRQWTLRPATQRPATQQTAMQQTAGAAAGASQSIETSHLVYEAYREMAEAQMKQLEQAARERWSLRGVAMVHRLGQVGPTEASVAIAVSCPHRSEAFEAAKWLIDELKHHVPIWKQEHYVQNGVEWIHPTDGSCQCTDAAPATASVDDSASFVDGSPRPAAATFPQPD